MVHVAGNRLSVGCDQGGHGGQEGLKTDESLVR